MKNKLLKRLTTLVVAAVMVVAMVTGFSVDVKAEGEKTTWGAVKSKFIGNYGYISRDDDSIKWAIVKSDSIEETDGSKVNIPDDIEVTIETKPDYVEYTIKTGSGHKYFHIKTGETEPVYSNFSGTREFRKGYNLVETSSIKKYLLAEFSGVVDTPFGSVSVSGKIYESDNTLKLDQYNEEGEVTDSYLIEKYAIKEDNKYYINIDGFGSGYVTVENGKPSKFILSKTIEFDMNSTYPGDDDDEKPEMKSESKYAAPKEENPAFTHPYREKLKSILPAKSVIASNGALYDDLKVFAVKDITKANQTLLVYNFAMTVGKKPRIILTDAIHTGRMLGVDNGKARILEWTNLEKNPQVVYACCYNSTDKAYFIQGVLDKNGTATFNNFLLRDATNITIFVLE